MSTRTETTADVFTMWQQGARALFDGYQENWKRWLGLTTGLSGGGRPDGIVERIVDGTREVAEAQLAVAGEWLRAPLWLTGAAPLDGLQERYQRLFEARRSLVLTYVDAITGWQQRAAETVQDVAETTAEAVEVATERGRAAARATRDTVLNGTREVVETVEQVSAETTRAASEVVSATANAAEQIAEQRQDEALPIKANVNAHGERIYHLPGQPNYTQVVAEERFTTEAEAQAAGYRRAQTPGGGKIKGKVNREGEQIYHLPGQANYDRLEPDMLFETEDEARAAGFRPAQR